MIVASFYEPPRDYKVKGSCQIEGWSQPEGAWFPVDTIGFGFNAVAPEKKSDNENDDSSSSGGSGNSSNNSTGSSKSGEEEEDFQEMAISKQVDTASCDLMFLSMQDRKKVKARGEKAASKLQADIHILQSVGVGKAGGHYVRHTYPSVMIHLEGVLIKQWSIQADGESRPTEQVQLKFDRAAIMYRSTRDGETYANHGPRGWDQTENKKFDWPFFVTKFKDVLKGPEGG